MKQRNKVFAGLSVAVAIAAIGGGAMVSASAMGSDGSSDGPTSKLVMLNMGTDGTAVQCTFEGADAAAILAASVPAIPTDDAAKAAANHITFNSGDATLTSMVGTDGVPGGTVPPGASTVKVSATITGSGTGPSTVIGTGGPLPPDGKALVLVSTDTARDGTAQECAAMSAAAINGTKP